MPLLPAGRSRVPARLRPAGTYRYTACWRTFQLRYHHRIHEPGVRECIRQMALNSSGIRDTARVLGICPQAVMAELKKSRP